MANEIVDPVARSFDDLARSVDEAVAFEELGRDSIARALSDGRTLTFAGYFDQGYAGAESKPKFPFILAQNPDQIAQLLQGILNGRMYDAAGDSAVLGTITPRDVSFEKRYDHHSLELEYKGTFRNGIYSGRWEFKQDTLDYMDNSGNFVIKRNLQKSA